MGFPVLNLNFIGFNRSVPPVPDPFRDDLITGILDNPDNVTDRYLIINKINKVHKGPAPGPPDPVLWDDPSVYSDTLNHRD
jgi:hypothetical protein